MKIRGQHRREHVTLSDKRVLFDFEDLQASLRDWLGLFLLNKGFLAFKVGSCPNGDLLNILSRSIACQAGFLVWKLSRKNYITPILTRNCKTIDLSLEGGRRVIISRQSDTLSYLCTIDESIPMVPIGLF